MSRPELSCDEVEALLPQVADGRLDQDADPVLYEHLARCHACQDALVRHDLIAVALERSRPALVRTSRSLVFRLPLPLAAAATLLFGAGIWIAVQSLTTAAAPAEPLVDVTRIPDPAGKVLYEIRQGDGVQLVDPERLDRPAETGAAADVQPVHLKRRPNR